MNGTTGFSRSPLMLLLGVNLRHTWRRLLSLREQSRLLTGVIGLFLAAYAALAFALFYEGLRFAGSFPGLGHVLIERMLFLLFAFLFALLLLSNVIISYTSLFRNRETMFLLPLPVPLQTLFQWKFIESMLLASWAFLFLVAPMLAAYGLTQRVAWHFYPMTALLISVTIVLPAVAGAYAAVLLARFMDRRSFQVGALLAAGLLLILGAIWLRPVGMTDEKLETRVLVVLDQMLGKTRFAQFPLLPSYWVAAGVQQWAEGALGYATFFALVLLSHVLFFGVLGLTRTGAAFYNAVSIVQSRGSALARWSWFHAWQRRRTAASLRPGWLENLVALIRPIQKDRRALIVKDIRVFWRDTTQWGQTVVLFGLLALYIFNLRHFGAQLNNPFWTHLVSYLNLGACALNLATVTTRFVYPQFSLEGKRVWIVGMAPLGLPGVLITKFVLSTAMSLMVTVGLMTLSGWMLKLDAERLIDLGLSVVVMTFTLNALAIGLGALYPNFKEDNPSRIVSGFGGTFCLVMSFLYIVISVVILAVSSPWVHGGRAHWPFVIGGRAAFIVLSLLVGVLPLRSGLLRLRKFEF